MPEMLYGTVTNERQRQHFEHASGKLALGRHTHESITSVVINDSHVSRNQLLVEQLAEHCLHIENLGRSTVFFRDGRRLDSKETIDSPFPVHLTVGQTVIEITDKPMIGDNRQVSQTLEVSAFDDVVFLAISDVVHDFPYPLATGYRQLSGYTSEAERYKVLLRLAENLMAYLGSFCLALLDEQSLRQLNEKVGGSVLNHWRGGISPGHWLDLSIHASSALRNNTDSPLCENLASLQLQKEKKGLGKILRMLIKSKNDFKHDRGPTNEREYQAGRIKLSQVLADAFQELDFLRAHPIYLVREVNPHRRDPQADVVLLKCMGSNPGFLSEQRVHPPSLRIGDLYVENSRSQLTTLYPFLHAGSCSRCGSREFYYIDRLDESVAGLKSFDRGHTESNKDVGGEMIGLLRSDDGA